MLPYKHDGMYQGAVGTLVELFTDKDNPLTSRQMCASILATMCKERCFYSL